MTQPTSSSPGFTEVFDLLLHGALTEVHTAMPGTIQSFDQDTQQATVQLGFSRFFEGDTGPSQFPLVSNVPVVMPGVPGGYLRIPVAVGDTGLVLFAERALDAWLLSGGAQDPGSLRTFNITDAIFIPGLTTESRVIKPLGDPTSIELSCGGTRIELTAEGKIRITNGAIDLLKVLDDLITHLSSAANMLAGPATVAQLIAGTATAQFNPATLTLLASDQAKLESLMP